MRRKVDKKESRVKQKSSTPPQFKRFGFLNQKPIEVEHIKVYKRGVKGEKQPIGDYDLKEIAQSASVEAFIRVHVKPIHGPGQYEIAVVDSSGREYDGGKVDVLGLQELKRQLRLELERVLRESPLDGQTLLRLSKATAAGRMLLAALGDS